MSKIKMWGLLAVVAVLVVFAAGWFVAVSPQKSRVAKLHDQAAAQEQTNQQVQAKVNVLKKKQSQIPIEQARIAAINGRLPSTPALASYIRSLTAAATAADVELVSIVPSPAAPVQVQAPAPAATAAGSAGSPAAGSAAPPPVASQSLSAIPVSISVIGSYYNVEQFLVKLEGLQRATVVSAITLAPGTPPQPQGGGSTAGDSGPNSEWKTLQTQITLSIFVSTGPATPVTSGNAASTGAQQTQPGAALSTDATQNS